MHNLFVILSLFTFLLISISCSTQKDQPDIVMLNEQIVEVLSESDGDFAVAFKNLKNGDTLFVNANQQFHAASTMKTPVMIELFKQSATGKFSFDDFLIVTTEFKSIVDGSPYTMDVADDSEDGLYNKIGSKVSIRTLMFEMITKSSNLATNMLIELVGADEVTATMRSLGAKDILVLRGVEDIKAFDKGMNNTTTAYDLMLIMADIATYKAVSSEASAQMEEILLEQHFNKIIPAKLPDDVKVAHKTGSITGVQHDSGIVILANGDKYVLVLLSKNLGNVDQGIEQMALVSRLIYDFVQAN